MWLRAISLSLLWALTVFAQKSSWIATPKIWDDEALKDWATPIAALGVRPGHFTSAEYYAAPVDNLMTYPVYRPDREPVGYWERLQKLKPLPLVEPAIMRTKSDWIKAGEISFRAMDNPAVRSNDPELIRAVRNIESYRGVWTQADGSLKDLRWIVTERGVELTSLECASCHSQPRADGSLFTATGGGDMPAAYSKISPVRSRRGTMLGMLFYPGDPWPVLTWRLFTTPWDPDERIEKWRTLNPADAAQIVLGGTNTTSTRPHSSPYFITKIPDLRNLRYSRYIDATGTHRLKGADDVARYAAFVNGADPMEFGKYKILDPKQRRVPVRYADEVLYAIGEYLLSLETIPNPEPSPAALVGRGRDVFTRETCVGCHVPPGYTSGNLTVALGFKAPSDHPNKADILAISVGTDPGLAMKTRKGTGLYKIPSLRGVWYRAAFLHDGSVASLEEMFDPARLDPNHVPGGWKAPGVERGAITGHPFGLGLNSDDKSALLAFLRSL